MDLKPFCQVHRLLLVGKSGKGMLLYEYLNLCQQITDLLRLFFSGPVFTYCNMAIICQRFCENKDTACPTADVFWICFSVISRTQRWWFPGFSKKLIRFFIHTDNRHIFIIWQFIDMQDIFHTGYKFCISFGRDAPVFIPVRLKFIFFNITRIVSLLTGSAIPFLFTSSVSSSRE